MTVRAVLLVVAVDLLMLAYLLTVIFKNPVVPLNFGVGP